MFKFLALAAMLVAAMPSCTQAERLPSIVRNNDGIQRVPNLAARQPRQVADDVDRHIISGSGSSGYKMMDGSVHGKGKGKGKGKSMKHNHGKSMKEPKASKGPKSMKASAKSMKESKSPKGPKGPKGKLAALEAKQSKVAKHVAGAGVALVGVVGLIALVATKLRASAATPGCADERTLLLAAI